MVQRKTALVLMLISVLVLHALILNWLHSQIQNLEPLVQMAAPLFTRTIEQQAPTIEVRGGVMPASGAKKGNVKNSNALENRATTDGVAEVSAASNNLAPSANDPDSASDPATQGNTNGAAQPAQPPASAPVQSAEGTRPDPAAPAASLSAPWISQDPALANTPAGAPPGDVPNWPPDTRLTYRLTGNYRGDLSGSAQVQWQRKESKYQVKLDLKLSGFTVVSLTSQGEVSDAGLLVRSYEEDQVIGATRRVGFAGDFVQFQDGTQLQRPPAVQDTASQFVELGHRFASGREVLKSGATVSVWLARPGGMDLWIYDVLEEELLPSTEFGPIAAFHLVPRPLAKPRGPITAEMWFAPRLQYLPVRVKITLGDGNFVNLMVDKIEQ